MPTERILPATAVHMSRQEPSIMYRMADNSLQVFDSVPVEVVHSNQVGRRVLTYGMQPQEHLPLGQSTWIKSTTQPEDHCGHSPCAPGCWGHPNT